MKLKYVPVIFLLVIYPQSAFGDIEDSDPALGINLDLPLVYETGVWNIGIRADFGIQSRLSLGYDLYDRSSAGLFMSMQGRLYTSADKRRFYLGYVASTGAYYGITVKRPQTFGNVDSYMHGPRIGITLPRKQVALWGLQGVWILDIYLQYENVTHLGVVLQEVETDLDDHLLVFGISAGIGFGRISD